MWLMVDERLQLRVSDGSVLLRIGPRRSTPSIVLNIIACAIATTIFFTSARVLALSLPSNGFVIIASVTAFSLCFAILTALQATWIMFGSETFEWDELNLTSTVALLGLQRRRRFLVHDVENPRVDANVSIQKGRPFVQRRLAFEYQGRSVYSYSVLLDEDLPVARGFLAAISRGGW